MIRYKLNPVIFLINNSGYTIEARELPAASSLRVAGSITGEFRMT